MLDQETNCYRSYINLYFIRSKIVKHTHYYEHVPYHQSFVSYICVTYVFWQRQNHSDFIDRKHHFCVNVHHQCKALLCFLSLALTQWHENPIFLYPSLLIFHHPPPASGRADQHDPILVVSSFVMWRFVKVLPFAQVVLQSCSNPDLTHRTHVLPLDQWWEFTCVLPKLQDGCMEENNRHTMEI